MKCSHLEGIWTKPWIYWKLCKPKKDRIVFQPHIMSLRFHCELNDIGSSKKNISTFLQKVFGPQDSILTKKAPGKCHHPRSSSQRIQLQQLWRTSSCGSSLADWGHPFAVASATPIPHTGDVDDEFLKGSWSFHWISKKRMQRSRPGLFGKYKPLPNRLYLISEIGPNSWCLICTYYIINNQYVILISKINLHAHKLSHCQLFSVRLPPL